MVQLPRWKIFVYTLLVLACTSCRKDKSKVQVGVPYSMNLIVDEAAFPGGNGSILDEQIILVEFNEDSVKFTDGVSLDRIKDSLFGVILLPDENYLIDPYVAGVLIQDEEKITIAGEYAAVKDSFSTIWGKLTIEPAW